MPPAEKSNSRRQEGEQEHLREDAGVTQQGLGFGKEPAEHLREDTGHSEEAGRKSDDKGLIEKTKDKLKGS